MRKGQSNKLSSNEQGRVSRLMAQEFPERQPHELGLGRLYTPDARDKRHLMSAVLAPLTGYPSTRHWQAGPVLDQGRWPACVGYAWRQFLNSAPLKTKQSVGLGPLEVYREAQKLDEWPGENYAGTSVRAGAKVLEAQGHLVEYVWAWDVETLRQYVLARGPVVMGTHWLTGMYKPTKAGFLEPLGSLDGGHAYLVIGYSHERRAFRMLNSWGEGWGQRGRAWIHYDAMQDLLEARDGEACSAIECRIDQ